MIRSIAAYLCLPLFCLAFRAPVFGRNGLIIGVGHVDGPAKINGLPFSDGANLYSGDRIETLSHTKFLVVAGPGERSVLGPDSLAELRKDGNSLFIDLEAGDLSMRSSGRTRVVLENRGLEIRPLGNSPSVASVEIWGGLHLKIFDFLGSIEIVGGPSIKNLQAGDAALVNENIELGSPEPETLEGVGAQRNHTSIVILSGAAAAAAIVAPYVAFHRRHQSPHKPAD